MRSRRRIDDVLVAVTGAVLIFTAWEIVQLASDLQPGALGVDLHTYLAATRHWLGTGSFYNPRQLAGHYAIEGASATYSGDILYPPIAIVLFLPFLMLPQALWWAIPIGIIAYAVWRHRPAVWAWPLMAICLAWPITLAVMVAGNPAIWIAAAAAIGTLYGWPAVLVLIKPTLAPFALIGVRHRSWWIALGVFALVSLAFGALWIDWLRAALINPVNGGIGYSLSQMPTMFFPLAAWAGRTANQRRGPGPTNSWADRRS